eukprot:6216632-Pyramimonas_sp.AAC.3
MPTALLWAVGVRLRCARSRTAKLGSGQLKQHISTGPLTVKRHVQGSRHVEVFRAPCMPLGGPIARLAEGEATRKKRYQVNLSNLSDRRTLGAIILSAIPAIVCTSPSHKISTRLLKGERPHQHPHQIFRYDAKGVEFRQGSLDTSRAGQATLPRATTLVVQQWLTSDIEDCQRFKDGDRKHGGRTAGPVAGSPFQGPEASPSEEESRGQEGESSRSEDEVCTGFRGLSKHDGCPVCIRRAGRVSQGATFGCKCALAVDKLSDLSASGFGDRANTNTFRCRLFYFDQINLKYGYHVKYKYPNITRRKL